MMHWLVVPIILPAFVATSILLFARDNIALHRIMAVGGTVVLLATSLLLLDHAAAGPTAYAIGSWPAPFGIIVVLDRLSAIMLVLAACIAMASLLYAINGWDRRGRHFHVLFQFQLVGINGAFLTGDIFNLFVFFEVMLIASYGLMLHGDGAWRLKAGFQYVAINLVASTLFLLAVGLIYAATGTLNMAHLSERIQALPADDTALLRTGALLLFAVFAVKSALVPLHWWLPGTYGAASAPAAALFAILTKVGAYSIIRLHSVVFSTDIAGVSTALQMLLIPAAIVTLVIGAVGVLASRTMLELASYSVIASMGTLLIAGAGLDPRQLTAALYYLMHSTVIGAAMFLLVDVVAGSRGSAADRLQSAERLPNAAVLGPLFMLAAMASVGLPPLSGFVGKIAILDSLRAADGAALMWTVILACSLLMIAGYARAGATLFWAVREPVAPHGEPHPARRIPAAPLAIVAVMIGLTAAMSVLGADMMRTLEATALEIASPAKYVSAVLPKVLSQVP